MLAPSLLAPLPEAVKKSARWGHRASNSPRNSMQITWKRRALTPRSHTVRIFSQLPALGRGGPKSIGSFERQSVSSLYSVVL